MDNIIGKRIKIVGDHPHTGETGTIDRVQGTALGKVGLVIKLENCLHGTNECFVFKPEHIVFLS